MPLDRYFVRSGDYVTAYIAQYPLRAPFEGIIIEKHITLGERLDNDANAFTIADLSSVWVDLNVYQKDLPRMRVGRKTSAPPMLWAARWHVVSRVGISDGACGATPAG